MGPPEGPHHMGPATLCRAPARGSLAFEDPHPLEEPPLVFTHCPVPSPLWMPLLVSSCTCFFAQGFPSVLLLFSILSCLFPTPVASTVTYRLSRPQGLPSARTSILGSQQVLRPLPGLSLCSTVPERGGREPASQLYSLGPQLF